MAPLGPAWITVITVITVITDPTALAAKIAPTEEWMGRDTEEDVYVRTFQQLGQAVTRVG